MKKLFILLTIIILVFFSSCTQKLEEDNLINQSIKTEENEKIITNSLENTTNSNNEENENTQLENQEITVQMDDGVRLTTPIIPSSGACFGGDIYIQENNSKEVIFKSRDSKTGLFPYCSPEIKKINNSKAQITICYEHGAGSGECSAAVFEYNIKDNSWKYIDKAYFSFDEAGKSAEVYDGEKVNELLSYMKSQNYNIKK